MEEYNLSYPIGKFDKPAIITTPVLENWIETIGSFPELLSFEVALLADEQLDTPYRNGGWTIRQAQPLFAEFEQVAVLPTECGLDSLMKLIKIKAGGNDNPAPNARLGFQECNL